MRSGRVYDPSGQMDPKSDCITKNCSPIGEQFLFDGLAVVQHQGAVQEQYILAGKLQSDPSFNGDKLQMALHKAILRLPDKQRAVFSLRYFQELKYEEIAEIMETSVGSLKASYHHAYKKIKEELQEQFAD